MDKSNRRGFLKGSLTAIGTMGTLAAAAAWRGQDPTEQKNGGKERLNPAGGIRRTGVDKRREFDLDPRILLHGGAERLDHGPRIGIPTRNDDGDIDAHRGHVLEFLPGSVARAGVEVRRHPSVVGGERGGLLILGRPQENEGGKQVHHLSII